MSDAVSLDELKRLLRDQQEKIEKLEKRVGVAERQAEAAEQYSRGDCLILRGRLAIRSDVSFRDEVMRLIYYHTGVRFPSWCLNTAHWLGGGTSIIVRFNNKAVRDEVYRNRVPKEVEKRGLFIHESLTASQMALVSKCATLRNQGLITTYYTQNGNVLVKKTKGSPSMLITTNMTTDDIITKLQNQPNTYREAVASGGQSRVPTNTNTTETTNTTMPDGKTEQATGNNQTTDGGTKETHQGGEEKQAETKPGEEKTTQKGEREVRNETDQGEKKEDTKATQKNTETQSGHEDETESQAGSDNTDESSDDHESGKGASVPKPANNKHKDMTQKVKATKQKKKQAQDESPCDESPSHTGTPAKQASKKRRNKQKVGK